MSPELIIIKTSHYLDCTNIHFVQRFVYVLYMKITQWFYLLTQGGCPLVPLRRYDRVLWSHTEPGFNYMPPLWLVTFQDLFLYLKSIYRCILS